MAHYLYVNFTIKANFKNRCLRLTKMKTLKTSNYLSCIFRQHIPLTKTNIWAFIVVKINHATLKDFFLKILYLKRKKLLYLKRKDDPKNSIISENLFIELWALEQAKNKTRKESMDS